MLVASQQVLLTCALHACVRICTSNVKTIDHMREAPIQHESELNVGELSKIPTTRAFVEPAGALANIVLHICSIEMQAK